MNTMHRNLESFDLLNYLQENNALLKVILTNLESKSDNPEIIKQSNQSKNLIRNYFFF